ncbi:AAA family ATPase [Planococcus dechangensis]|uniref:AAA family ATPase n=1 Tax=Planococcus dechangensis TaxID=1176255 RepID=A0ABV9M9H3_9BACL
MNQTFTDFEEWLSSRHQWLQVAAARLLKNNTLSDMDLTDLIELCKTEALSPESSKKTISKEKYNLSAKDPAGNLRIDAINSVKGISALGPKKPLNFNNSLSIIYGQNGSGKSSYVRLLKHVSGTEKAGKLRGNVYLPHPQPQECSLTISINDSIKEILWNPELGAISELSALHLYDTDCANVYVNEENEVAYEPWLLQFLSQLTNTSIEVGKAIKSEMDGITLTKLNPPEKSNKTKAVEWLNKTNASTTNEEVAIQCSWEDADEHELISLRQQATETDPLEKMKKFNDESQNIENLCSLLTSIRSSLSDELCTKIIDAKRDYVIKKKAAEEDADKIFENLPIDGVSTESWQLLWEQARSFSEQHAYKTELFPYTSIESVCVLCQQPLSEEAQSRLESFEFYVKSSLSKQVKIAEEHLNNLLSSFKEIPTESILKLHLKSSGITSNEIQEKILTFCEALKKRSGSLKEATALSQLISLPFEEILLELKETSVSKKKQANEYQKLSEIENRAEIHNNIIELETRKWLKQNKEFICENVEKTKRKAELKIALSLTNTQALSTKKSSLSDQLITSEYIKRFQKELKELGGSRINVNLIKTRAEKGRIYHQIKLKNSAPTIKTSEVLSEGEFRIVSLAGFLADVEGSSSNTPFIFDDPMSSLDQVFEEATVKRIAKLSLTRQVIIFTHRLSFLSLLEEAANKLEVEYNAIWLRSESWGTGEPGETPIFAKRPEKALNFLMNERLSKAKKVLQEEGRIEYDLLAKGICSDFRILIERLIENDLLADVVQRFRRSVNTMGKIHKLANISAEDCKMFEGFMTKYSTYEHSQSYETPVILPEPDELKEDMETIKVWLGEFKKRNTA